jgi:hypothetical protein
MLKKNRPFIHENRILTFLKLNDARPAMMLIFCVNSCLIEFIRWLFSMSGGGVEMRNMLWKKTKMKQ